MAGIPQGVKDMIAGNMKDVPMREKTWDERSSDERLELLRREVRSLTAIVDQLLRTTQVLESHQHAASGEILVRPGSMYGNPTMAGRWRDGLA